MDPGESGLAWADSWLEGISTNASAGFAWHREQLRIDAATTQVFSMHIAAHQVRGGHVLYIILSRDMATRLILDPGQSLGPRNASSDNNIIL
jgi:hypothetical protein